jgi:hypothetical protein
VFVNIENDFREYCSSALSVCCLVITHHFSNFKLNKVNKMSDDYQYNVPAGLRDPILFKSKDAAVVQDLDQNISTLEPTIKSVLQAPIESKFLGNDSAAPVLEKDTLDPKFVAPNPTKLDSKYNLAKNLEPVVESQYADTIVQDLISANHQLRNNNLAGAQDTLGRPLTETEIQTKQVTPVSLGGQKSSRPVSTTETDALAQAKLSAGDFTGAATILKRALTKEEIDSKQLNYGISDQVSQLLRNGDYVKAAELLKRPLTNEEISRGAVSVYQAPPPSAPQRPLPIFPPPRKRPPLVNPNLPGAYMPSGEEIIPWYMYNHDPYYQALGKAEPNYQALWNWFGGSGIGPVPHGHMMFGKFEIDRKKLQHGGQLSVRYAQTKRKVNGLPNMRVSPKFVENIMGLANQTGLKHPLDSREQKILDTVIQRSEANIPLQSLGLDKDSNSVKQLYTIIAEIESGNDSRYMKREAEKLLDFLEHHSHISKQLASQIRSSYL